MREHPFELAGSGGKPIRGEVSVPDEDREMAVVVLLHGFKGFRKWGFHPEFVREFTEARNAVVAFDMSHNGVGSGGLEHDEEDLFEANTFAREEEDLRVVLDALRGGELPGTERVDTKRLGLFGHSRGGGLAVVHAAADEGVRAVVALAPISTTTRRFTPEQLEEGRKQGFLPIMNTRTGQVMKFGADAIAEVLARTDLHDIAASHASKLQCPLLVCHGLADTSVPPDEGKALAEAAPDGTFLGIPDADHVLNCRHPWAGETEEFRVFVGVAETFLHRKLG